MKSTGVASSGAPFCAVIADDTMEPRYRRGAAVYVDPGRVPLVGDEVFITQAGREPLIAVLLETAGPATLVIRVGGESITLFRGPGTEFACIIPVEELLI